jgi:hypothetical protein
VALRLGALYQLTGDPRSAVQVLRSGLNTVQSARDAAISQDIHSPLRQDDQLALSAASIACFFDVVVPAGSSDDSVIKRPAAGAYGGSGLFGAESQARLQLFANSARVFSVVIGCCLGLSGVAGRSSAGMRAF